MKQLFSRNALILAALLQVLPVVRNIATNPATTSTFAIILRWTIGASAAVGAYDTVSGSSTVVFTNPTNFNGTVGVFFTNNVAITNNGGDTGAYFVLNNSTTFSSQLSSGMSTTSCMPQGLTFTVHDANNGGSPKPIYGSMTGTVTNAMTNFWVHILAGFQSLTPAQTDVYFTFTANSSSPPLITNQPVSLTNLVGSSPNFTVTAGPPPLAYQWRFNTNTVLAAATNFSLTITNVQLTNAGYYNVVITNSRGAITSSPALLTVWKPPVITNQPVGLTNLAGAPATFNVTAGGVPALSYQWKFNTNTALLNATGTSFTITNVHLSQAGTYSVVVTNAAGSLTSSPAILSVTTPASPRLASTSIGVSGNVFQFTFNPVAGLTNAVQTNTLLAGGIWSTMTNIAPPATTNAITVTDIVNTTNRFYRVQINP